MRKLLFAAAALVALPSLASAQVYIADSYPPAAGVVIRPPVVAAPMVESQVYLAPGTTYVQPGTTYVEPGTEWEERPIIVEGRR